jgi:hypothetical protein
MVPINISLDIVIDHIWNKLYLLVVNRSVSLYAYYIISFAHANIYYKYPK